MEYPSPLVNTVRAYHVLPPIVSRRGVPGADRERLGVLQSRAFQKIIELMLVVTWNVQGNRGLGSKRRERIVEAIRSVAPDILLLQEVAIGSTVEAVTRDLRGIGFESLFYSGVEGASAKAYGNVVASRWHVEGDSGDWSASAPWPQLLARAVVQAPSGRLLAYSAHVPNGAGNGWRKIDTFEVLAKGLFEKPDLPTILGGDFNEPKSVQPDGTVIPFGGIAKPGQPVRWSGDRRHTKSGDPNRDTFPRARWRDGVLSVLGRGADHGLRHAWFDRHGFTEVATHMVRGKPRFFDHILVSDHFEVEAAGYYSDWRTPGPSDHAGGWAKLNVRRAGGTSG